MISCNHYDYIEIVCMYLYPIKITLKSGEKIRCKAIDTKRNISGEECIEVALQGDKKHIILNEISELRVEIENPHFHLISFE